MDYEAIVYDLDGTLARLIVNWDAVRTDVAAVLSDHHVDTSGVELWDMLELANEANCRDAVEAAIAAHERPGAERSRRLPLADELPHSVPVGVCSLNCVAACELALERHEIHDHVDAVVGRDSVATEKPNPEPLLEAIDRLGANQDATLFIGDSDSDEVAARRAGTDFQFVRHRVAD
jgi:phosphoglycolate phosphatase